LMPADTDSGSSFHNSQRDVGGFRQVNDGK
jgi:hypothetical protein